MTPRFAEVLSVVPSGSVLRRSRGIPEEYKRKFWRVAGVFAAVSPPIITRRLVGLPGSHAITLDVGEFGQFGCVHAGDSGKREGNDRSDRQGSAKTTGDGRCLKISGQFPAKLVPRSRLSC